MMIVHIDMDAYYASVEIRDNPSLQGMPVVVGGSATGRGVVSAASYEARKFGIHSAMPSSQVFRHCPNAVFIRPRMNHYAEISRQIRGIFDEFTSLVEPLSLDEAFLDVTGCERLWGDAESIARKIKTRIHQDLGLVASAGVAPNKYLAKVASDLDKPNGLVVVDPTAVEAFLDPLPIKRIWGVGKKCELRFSSIGVKTIGQLRRLSLDQLRPMFGVNAQHFFDLARGNDSRPVTPDRVARTISHESTFSVDITSRETLEAWTIELCEQVGRRLRRHDIKGRTIQLKLRFSDFRTITRATTFTDSTDLTRDITEAAVALLSNELPQTHEPIRLLGVGVSNLIHQPLTQRLLFDEAENEKHRELDRTKDNIREKFGGDALSTGKSLEQQIRRRKE